MRRGFTIIELLVASLLLGMLVTILTMIFNQSSIAWRIGKAMTDNMDDVRDNVAELREEADNVFVYNDQVYRNVGLWKENGQLRNRACDATGSDAASEGVQANLLSSKARSFLLERSPWKDASAMISVDGANGRLSRNNFIVNVMSKGPRNDERDWEAIFSYPDDPEEWCK